MRVRSDLTHLVVVMRDVKQPLKLFWVETADQDEDWFVVARTARQASRFFEDSEGYDPRDATADLVVPIPEAPETSSIVAPCWPSDEVIRMCGGRFVLHGDTRVVQLAGRTYAEGLLEHEIRARETNLSSEPS